MKFSVHCEGTPAECAAQLTEMAKVVGGAEETSAISIADIKAKRGRKSKAEKEAEAAAEEEAEEVEADDETEEDDISKDEPEADEEDFEDEESEDEEKLSEADLAKLKSALKNYSVKVNKKKAVGILKQYAERSDLVKPADLPKLLKALKV